MKNENTICGSRLYSKPEVFKKEVADFLASTKSIICDDNSSLADRHNAFTAYCLIAINYDSGHRPVRDPMAYREDVDLENGWLLINDKSSSKATETRVVAISDGSVSIFSAYLRHLTGLACELSNKENLHELASEISSLVTPQHYAKQSLPLFFFLNNNNDVLRISPGSLKRVVRNKWRYELNHNRHFLETNLSKKGLSSLLIDCHVGHQHGISHPLGINSNLTHMEYTLRVKPLLNALFDESGWEVVCGFESDDAPISISRSKKSVNRYGQYERRIRRNRLGKYISDEAMGIAIHFVDKYGIENVCSDEGLQKRAVEQLFSEVKIAKHYKRKAISALSSSFIEIAKNEGVDLKVSISQIILEESPFVDRWVAKYKKGEDLKNRLIKEVTLQEFRPRSLEEGWAYVVASAICVGGLYNEEWSRCLMKKGPGSVKKMMNWVVYVDIWSVDKDKNECSCRSPDWRWHPDAVSKALILSMIEQLGDLDIKGFSYVRCVNHFNRLTQSIDLNVAKKRDSLSTLCSVVREYWVRYLPAYIARVMDGDIKTSPLSETAMARLCYGRRISCERANESESKKIVIRECKNGKPASVLDYMYSVSVMVVEVESRDQSERSVQLESLRNKLQTLHGKHQYPEICRALSQWLVHVTLNGTPKKAKPSINTIKRYFNSIATPLCLLLYNYALSELNEEKISSIYKKVVEHNHTDATMRDLALRQFHDVVNVYGLIEVDELNWFEISETIRDLEPRKPDTNIVTSHEVLQSLNAVFKTVSNTYVQHVICAAIILCFRFGLRISELSRLRIQDIQIDGEDIVLHMVPTEFGKLKSYSGVRQVPLLGKMTEVEIEIITQQLKVATELQEKGNNSLLIFNPYNPEITIDIEWLRRYIHATIRHVCGDQSIRIHHLRHSYVTTVYYALVSEYGHNIARTLGLERDELIDNIMKKFNVAERDVMPLGILSLIAGHASVLTSIHTYSHLVDEAVTGYVDEAVIQGLSITGISKLLGQDITTLKNRANKYGLNRGTNVAHSVLRSIRPSHGIPNFEMKLEKWPQRIPLDYHKRRLDLWEINRILTMYGVNNHDINHISHYTGFDLDVLVTVLKAASILTNKISLEIYGDIDKNDNSWFDGVNYSNNIVMYDSLRFRGLLNVIQNIINSKESMMILEAMVNAWVKSILSQERGLTLRFGKPGLLSEFLSGAELLGYRRDNFYARHSQFLDGKYADSMKIKLGKMGVSDVRSGSLRRMESGKSIQRLAFVDVNFKEQLDGLSLPYSMKALSNALFLAGTMIEFESLLKSN